MIFKPHSLSGALLAGLSAGLPGHAQAASIADREGCRQLSFKIKAMQGVFGHDNLDLWLGYTATSFWQAYNRSISSPFREINYEPEAMLVFRTNYFPKAAGSTTTPTSGTTWGMAICGRSTARAAMPIRCAAQQLQDIGQPGCAETRLEFSAVWTPEGLRSVFQRLWRVARRLQLQAAVSGRRRQPDRRHVGRLYFAVGSACSSRRCTYFTGIA